MLASAPIWFRLQATQVILREKNHSAVSLACVACWPIATFAQSIRSYLEVGVRVVR